MTRRKILGAGLAGLMALFGVLPTVAFAGIERPRIRHYHGSTSQGGSMAVTTAKVGSTIELREVEFDGTLNCDDTTQIEFGMGIGFADGTPLPPGRLDLDSVSLSDALHIQGRLGAHAGSGTISFTIAALTADEQAQLCATGELTWQLHRTQAGAADPPGSRFRTLTVAGPSATTTTVTTSGVETTRRIVIGSVTATATGSSRPRHYVGKNSQGLPMSVVTAKAGSAVELRRIGFGWTLSCGDGAQFGFGEGIVFGGAFPLDPGRLDMDEASLFEALHIHGRLGVHAGSGTLSDAIPALTADEQAQLCSSGDLTWRAWRTDPGKAIE